MFVVRYTVPDRPEYSLVFPDRKVECVSLEEAKRVLADLVRDGCRDVRITGEDHDSTPAAKCHVLVARSVPRVKLTAEGGEMPHLVPMTMIVRAYDWRCLELGVDWHWFDAGAMRFFNTRLARFGWRTADGAFVFVTSERQDGGHPRAYTVRRFDPSGDAGVQTVGDFQAYSTRRAAHAAARAIAGARVRA